MMKYRIGHGYDVHRFAEDRRLVLGGVQIPSDRGLAGHSDADVVLHALCDALLGAAALGDIGQHFSDQDDRWKDADSRDLLRHCYQLVSDKGYQLENADITLLLQKPKIAPYTDRMRSTIAAALDVNSDQISVKATTEEGLGFTGSGEGAACHAVVLISHG